MGWYRLTFETGVIEDLATAGAPMAQRLLEKSKWIASNVENLRHEVMADLPGLHKYAVADWRIFYQIDRTEQVVNIHAIVHRNALRK
jgi:mRNA interferase RelE/StbE